MYFLQIPKGRTDHTAACHTTQTFEIIQNELADCLCESNPDSEKVPGTFDWHEAVVCKPGGNVLQELTNFFEASFCIDLTFEIVRLTALHVMQ